MRDRSLERAPLHVPDQDVFAQAGGREQLAVGAEVEILKRAVSLHCRDPPAGLQVVDAEYRVNARGRDKALIRGEGDASLPLGPDGPRRATILSVATFQTTVLRPLPVAAISRPSWLDAIEPTSPNGPRSSPTTASPRERQSVTRFGARRGREVRAVGAHGDRRCGALGRWCVRTLPAAAVGAKRNGRPSRRWPRTSHTITLPSFDPE